MGNGHNEPTRSERALQLIAERQERAERLIQVLVERQQRIEHLARHNGHMLHRLNHKLDFLIEHTAKDVDPAALAALGEKLKTSGDALAAAVDQNTPPAA